MQWYIRNFEDDLITSNAAEIVGLALFLRRIGNTRAELITPTGRSVLPDGRPSPHAWRMIDEPALGSGSYRCSVQRVTAATDGTCGFSRTGSTTVRPPFWLPSGGPTREVPGCDRCAP